MSTEITSLQMHLQMLKFGELQGHLALRLIRGATENLQVAQSPVISQGNPNSVPAKTEAQKIDVRV